MVGTLYDRLDKLRRRITRNIWHRPVYRFTSLKHANDFFTNYNNKRKNKAFVAKLRRAKKPQMKFIDDVQSIMLKRIPEDKRLYLDLLEEKVKKNPEKYKINRPPENRTRTRIIRRIRKRRIKPEHGEHYKYFNNLNKFIKYYLYNVYHRGHKSSGRLYDFLVKMFNEKKFYSLKTRKWIQY